MKEEYDSKDQLKAYIQMEVDGISESDFMDMHLVMRDFILPN